MKKQIIVFIIFISLIAFDLNAQTIFYNEDGLKVNKTDATSYRIYKLDMDKVMEKLLEELSLTKDIYKKVKKMKDI